MTPVSPAIEARDKPQDAHPVAASVIMPAPNVRFKLPLFLSVLIFSTTSSVFTPNKNAVKNKNIASSKVIAEKEPVVIKNKMLRRERSG